MPTICGRLATVLFLVAVFLLTAAGIADAQEDRDQIRFIFTPQIWLENIPKMPS